MKIHHIYIEDQGSGIGRSFCSFRKSYTTSYNYFLVTIYTSPLQCIFFDTFDFKSNLIYFFPFPSFVYIFWIFPLLSTIIKIFCYCRWSEVWGVSRSGSKTNFFRFLYYPVYLNKTFNKNILENGFSNIYCILFLFGSLGSSNNYIL